MAAPHSEPASAIVPSLIQSLPKLIFAKVLGG
jgi:hypothetical protein